ncbi:hypothetical protein P692DRAFT_20880473 [Suillus brevipes Sb2]|nr:hypothetical protein P692DRAFT_20880473 [Suillus brevipes Sb2]
MSRFVIAASLFVPVQLHIKSPMTSDPSASSTLISIHSVQSVHYICFFHVSDPLKIYLLHPKLHPTSIRPHPTPIRPLSDLCFDLSNFYFTSPLFRDFEPLLYLRIFGISVFLDHIR